MAMFVLVVDTSLMNVSISAVVDDLDTTVSSVQSAIALEALVSAAFILIGSKVGDLIGRKRAYVLGLLGYAIGALAMALAQSITAIIIFWAIDRRARRVAAAAGDAVADPRQLRGRRAAQGLRAGRRGGRDRRRGRARCSAGSSPPTCRGASAFLLEVVVIAVVLSGIKLVRDVPYTGSATGRRGRLGPVGRSAWAASCSASWSGRRVASRSARCWPSARSRWARWSGGWCAASASGKPTLLDPDLFRSKLFRLGITGQMLQQIALGGTMIALPIYLQMVLEYNAMEAGLSLAPLSLTHVRGRADRREEGRRAAPGQHHPRRVRAARRRAARAAPDRAPRRLRLVRWWSR